jgi:hypothetical protein
MMYFTPGHTPGTISSVFQVKDNGKTHTVALWGGMGLNNDRASLTQYIASNKKFQDVAKQAGADIILSNHTDWDRSKINLPDSGEPRARQPKSVCDEQCQRAALPEGRRGMRDRQSDTPELSSLAQEVRLSDPLARCARVSPSRE